MGESCPRGQYWDFLVKKCLGCHVVCKKPDVTKCLRYCEPVQCRLVSGHYYDTLLKKCVKCTQVCGRHPAECSPHCQTTSLRVTPPPSPFGVTSGLPNSRGISEPMPLENSTVLLYALLALCLVLLFSSLSLALAVFLRGSRAKTQRTKETKNNQSCVGQPSDKVRGGPKATKDFATNWNGATEREPSDDSIPTETCVCVHCFPDLKTLGHGSDRPFSFNQHAVLTPHIRSVKDGSLGLHSTGMQLPTEVWQGEDVHPFPVKSRLLTKHGEWMNESRTNQI